MCGNCIGAQRVVLEDIVNSILSFLMNSQVNHLVINISLNLNYTPKIEKCQKSALAKIDCQQQVCNLVNKVQFIITRKSMHGVF